MRDGYFSHCKTCHNEQGRKRYEPKRQANAAKRKARAEARAEAEFKTCSKCGKVKPLSEFHKDNSSADGRASQCRECASAYGRSYRENQRSSEKIASALKTCSRCGITVPATEEFFPRRSESPDGLRSICRECKSEYDKEYRDAHKEHVAELNRIWQANHPEECKIACKKYRDTHKEQRKISVKKCNDKHHDAYREYTRNYQNTRRHNEPGLRLSHAMSSGIGASLRNKKAGRHWEQLVGYTLEDLMQHLEPLLKPGMTFDNYGVDGWVLDHSKPQRAFSYSSPDDPDFKACWSLENLQPMWFKDNSVKGARYQGVDYRYHKGGQP